MKPIPRYEEREDRESLTDTVALGGLEAGLGEMVGTSTGEAPEDVLAGGWQGTDDATSTAPSDVGGSADMKHSDDHGPEAVLGRAFAGGAMDDETPITDIKGTPAEESRDWEHDPIVEEP